MITTRQLVRRWAWGLGISLVFLLAIWQLETVSTLLLLSFLTAYVLNPLVTRLANLRFLNRAGATLITLFGLLLVFLTVLFIIVPEVITEFKQLVDRAPEYLVRLRNSAVPWIEANLDFHVPVSFGGAFEQFGRDIKEIIGPATKMAFGGTRVALGAVVAFVMFPLFLFFLLKDFVRIIGALDDLVPRRNRANFHELIGEIDQSLSAFLHGQFTVMIILGVLYSVGYLLVGIPVAIGVGVLTGMLCFIPYVGAATGFVLATLLSLLEFQGLGTVFGVAVVFASVQLFDGLFITPNILGSKLGLGPLWIIVALMAGGEIFGFMGVLLAVPTVAVMKVLVIHTIDRYKESGLYNSMERSSAVSDEKTRGDAAD